MNITDLLIYSVSISMILFYLYETDVVWEYLNKASSIFRSKKMEMFFYGKLLLKAYENDTESSNYINFINKIYNNFTTRLVSCPICFGFWVSIIFGSFTDMKTIPLLCFLSLILYFIIKILTKFSSKI